MFFGKLMNVVSVTVRQASRAKAQVAAAGLVLAMAPWAAGGKEKPNPQRGDAKVDKIASTADDLARRGAQKPTENHPIAPAVQAARASLEAVKKLDGYTATFIKQEQLKKGKPLTQQVMQLKLRRQPFSVYLKFTDPHEGREVIYVEGRNKGKLLVHEPSGLASLAGTISLAPTGDRAMEENRYPVTMLGLEKLLETVLAQWEPSLAGAEATLQTYPQAKIGDVECIMYEVTHAQPQEHVKFHRVRLYLNKQNQAPVKVEAFDFPAKGAVEAPLVEAYTYWNLDSSAALTDLDFDVKNKAYGFK